LTASLSYLAQNQTATERLGRELAQAVPETMVIGLDGPLGAGKTTLVRAFAIALGIEEHSIASPTFVLLHQYRGPRAIFHFDAYRVASVDEFFELGCEECFAGPGVTLVEWAQRVADCLPNDRIEITITIVSPEARRFDIHGNGPIANATIRRLATLLDVEVVDAPAK
jgi:tRNA threonylcarbamoyladenosine biosynthesis protein TsaE